MVAGRRLALAAGLCAAAAAAHAGPRAEVMHWWTSGGESPRPSRCCASAYTRGRRHLGRHARSPAATRRAPSTVNRIIGGNPPTAAQFNTSKQFLDIIDQGMLNNVDVRGAARTTGTRSCPRRSSTSIKVKGHYYAVPVDIHMPDLVLVLEAPRLPRPASRAEPQDARRVVRRPRQAQGRRPGPAGPRRPAVAGEDHVLRMAVANVGGRRHVHEADTATATRRRSTRRPFSKVLLARSSGCKTTSIRLAGPQLERRHRAGDLRQGRRADHGRLGQGRVHRRRPDRRQGVRLLPRLRRRQRPTCRGRRVRVPEDRRRRRGQGAEAAGHRGRRRRPRRWRSATQKGSIPIRADVDVSQPRHLRAEGHGDHEGPLAPAAVARDADLRRTSNGALQDVLTELLEHQQSVDDAPRRAIASALRY